MNAGKTLNETFSWINGESLKYALLLLVISLLGWVAAISLIFNFVDFLLSALKSGIGVTGSAVLLNSVIEFIIQLVVLGIVFAIITYLATIYVLAFALRKFGNSASSFSIAKAVKAIVASLVIVIVIVITLLVAILLSGLLMFWLGIIGAIVGIVILALDLFFSIYFLVRTGFATESIVDLDVGIIQSLRESFALTKGRAWKVFGYTFLIAIVIVILSFVLSFIVGLALSPVTNSVLGPAVNSKMAQAQTIITSFIPASSSGSIAPLLSVYTQSIVKNLNESLASAIVSFFTSLSVLFLYASMYTQLKQEKNANPQS